MQIEVSLTLQLPASCELEELDVDSLEEQVLEAGRRAMQQAMLAATRQYEIQMMTTSACPRCGCEALRSEGTDKRVLLALFGRVELPLRRVRCLNSECGQRFRPADGLLKCLGSGNITGQLRQACVLAGTSWPFGIAAGVLGKLCGAQVSREKLRQFTEQAGTRQARDQREQAEKLLKAPTMHSVLTERDAELRRPINRRRDGREQETVERLLVGLDGGWVPCREQQGGMEGKVGVLASEWETINKKKDRHRLTKRRYVATFGTSEQLGELAYAACVELGGDEAKEQVVLGDGAEWIKSEANMHFPWSRKILDWPHVSRAMHKAIRTARPGPKHQQLRKQLHQMLGESLWHGHVEEVLRELKTLRLQPSPNERVEDVRVMALEEAISYLQAQWEAGWLGNYQAWKEAGYPVGSGMVEREVELVINRRMKKRGGRWCRPNADGVVALRVCTLNQDWEHANHLRVAA